MRLTLAAAATLSLILAALGRVGTPGPEASVALGALLPLFAAAMGARLAIAARPSAQEAGDADGAEEAEENSERSAPPALSSVLGAVFVLSFGAWLLATLILSLNMLRVRTCEPLLGLAFLALGPGLGVLLAGLAGALIGALIEGPRRATLAAVAVPLLGILWTLYRFWDTPAIFAYGHFFGYFPGALYDAEIRIHAPYLSLRALSLAWLGAGLCLAFAAYEPARGRLSLERLRRAPWLAALGLLLALAGVVGELEGPALGHRSTADSIAEALGGRVDGWRCTAIVPREMAAEDARRLARDCSFRVDRVERLLGARHEERVVAFFFRSPEEKLALMGASHTYIAKPWRHEVYLQVGAWPHPVLFHEVAHVVAGSVGRGPFRIAGSLGGLIPSPTIIEGLAVAIAWEGREGLTPHEWARAMIAIDRAPRLSEVLGLSFLLQSAPTAYTVAGSFVRWVMDTRGNEAVRRLYRSGDVEEALGEDLGSLERAWRAYLEAEVPLPEEARALAELRFSRPGIFAQVCPSQIATLSEALLGDLAAGRDRAAAEGCREILEIDEGEATTRARLVGALARLGEGAESEAELARLIGPPSAAPPVLSLARELLADAHWIRGDGAQARALYEELLGEPRSRDAMRQIDVKLLALREGGEVERGLFGLMIGRRSAQEEATSALHYVGRVRAARGDGLADYLEARQLMSHQRYDLAAPLLRRARAAGLPAPRLEVEARRMHGIALYGVHQRARSAAIWRAILRAPEGEGPGRISEADREEARDWLARIRWWERRARSGWRR